MAEDITLGGSTLTLSEGWEYSDEGATRQLTRSFAEASDERGAGIATIAILGPFAEAGNDFDDNFQTLARGTLPALADEDPDTAEQGFTTSGHRIRVDARCCERREGVSFGQTLVGVPDDHRQIFLMLVTGGLRGENREAAEADFAATVRSLRLNPDDEGFALIPTRGDGGLEGVYTHLSSGLQINVLGGMDYTSESEIMVFDRRGRFGTELPTGGVTLSEFCAEDPRPCGTYRLEGDHIILRAVANDYGLLEEESLTFAVKGEDLLIDDETHFRIPPFAEGSILNGTWTHLWSASGNGASSSSSVASQRSLTLRPDGTFMREGWFGATTASDTGGVTVAGDRPAQRGTYRLEDTTLALEGDDGSIEMMSIFAPDIGSDELLVIEGLNFLKE
ncbi:hypothetical protein M3484_04625 [Pseudomonas sp. GX19020]|uniref:hypothetical protein n=1 Tax=Pseudomonas sp. GX19020 TaxID=2942277 RepID=UPI0020190106|nr:hypothetical protein [Pseudomonas sp. GX19020]MCL4065848.1 hypothetical protein [Pseudomonas sp. GX19020]